MKRTIVLEELRQMRFKETYEAWQEKRMTQEEAARLLGVCERSFRRYIAQYEEEGLDGLRDKRVHQVSSRRASEAEVTALLGLYRTRYSGWNVQHFYRFYQERHEGDRSYTWVKDALHREGFVQRGKQQGKHRRKRERAPVPGMLLHQDGSDHAWVAEQRWDLIVTLDDATNEHYSMFFVEEEGTESSLQGIKEVIESKGLCCALYTDRGSHYWTTPEAGGKVDKEHLTQFGRAMRHLGIEMIAAYSPEARGRSERAFRTHQGRLPQELALEGIATREQANAYLKTVYMPAYNREFSVPAAVEGNAFVPWSQGVLDDILCQQYERQVGKDNCIRFDNHCLQIPQDHYRCHYAKMKVRVHQYLSGELGVFYGPRKLAHYTAQGERIQPA